MKTIKYQSSIDDDVKKNLNLRNADERQFDFLIMCYLNSPDGWAQEGYFFEQTDRDPTVYIRLSSKDTVRSECRLSKNLSCAEVGGSRMFINADRWFHGSAKSGHDLENYRQYVVSHEMGHILGKGHAECPKGGGPAPIMMQQTLGIGKCIPNTNVKA